MASALLASNEPAPFLTHRENASGTAVLTCDHASKTIPRALGDLGVADADRNDHIAWDIGASDLARAMSEQIDATLIETGYSRLVVDANRPLSSTSSMPEVTCGIDIPGNRQLTEAQREARRQSCFEPYHNEITRILDKRVLHRPTLLLSIHSYTPNLYGQHRPWHVGIMYGRDRRLASLFLDILEEDESLVVGDNQPYQVTDGGDFTIPHHAERRGLLAVLIEVRNDLLRTAEQVEAMATRLAGVYRRVESRVSF